MRRSRRAGHVAAAALLVALTIGCAAASPGDGDGAAAVAPATTGEVDATATTAGRRAGPPRVAVVGDSTAERLAPAIEAWGSATGEVVYVGNASRLGCPLGRGGSMHTAADVTGPVNEECDWESVATTGVDGAVRPTFGEVASRWAPDLVVVSNGVWDVADRQRQGEDDWHHVGEPDHDEWLLGELLAATDALSADGARVVWLTASPWEGATRNPPERLYPPAADPARVVAYNRVLDRVVAARPDSASIVDLAGWLDATGEDARLRADGAHFDPDTAAEVVDRYLGEALLATWSAPAVAP